MKKNDYLQTWPYISKLRRWSIVGKPLVWLAQSACGLIVGHELSKTEWGYGGGDTADRWCRWCNKRFVVPKESIYFAFKESNPRDLMGMVGKEIDES